MRYGIIVLSFTLVFGMAFSADADSFWPMFQRDPGHTGLAPVSTPENLQLMWEVDIATVSPRDFSHLVMGNDGCVWAVGTKILAVSPDGQVNVEFRFPSDLAGSFKGDLAPVVLGDGALVVLAHVRVEGQFIPHLFAIEPWGELRWTLPLEGRAGLSLLTLGPQGSIYAASENYLYKVSEEPQIQWSYQCDTEISTVPAVAADGSIYFGAKGDILYCLSPEGSLNWTLENMWLLGAPTVDADGRVYIATTSDALYCLNSDGSVQWSYPNSGTSYTSPVLLPDGSVVFNGAKEMYGNSIICVDSSGAEKWALSIDSNQKPLASPVADADGNVYIGYYLYEGEPPNYVYHRRLARISPTGSYEEFYVDSRGTKTNVGGFCIGGNGMLYAHNGNLLCAFGAAIESPNLSVSTRLSSFDMDIGWLRATSIHLANPLSDMDADCYIAYRRKGSEELFFYPFWSNEPSGSALEFRPLSAGAEFPKIELIHTEERTLVPGEYEYFAGLFEPGTLNPLLDIASCEFTVYAQPIRGQSGSPSQQTSAAIEPASNETSLTVQLWTDKRDYTAGETLDLSLSIDNQGFGMPFDLYIAAKMDADPTGTLFFFPTWATDPSFTNISFLPLVQGAILPDLTIMHLELPDSLPKGDYTFLAAFFVSGRFDLASEIAESHWTLM